MLHAEHTDTTHSAHQAPAPDSCVRSTAVLPKSIACAVPLLQGCSSSLTFQLPACLHAAINPQLHPLQLAPFLAAPPGRTAACAPMPGCFLLVRLTKQCRACKQAGEPSSPAGPYCAGRSGPASRPLCRPAGSVGSGPRCCSTGVWASCSCPAAGRSARSGL